MALHNWTEIDGTIYGNPKLSSQARMVSAKMTKLNDLVDPADDFALGKKSGDSVGFRLVGRISASATTPIGEFTPVPFTKPPYYTGTGTVDRYAQAIAWTGEMEDLDRLDVEDTNVRALNEHYGRTRNSLIDTALTSGRSFTYVSKTSSTYDFNTDGTVTDTAGAAFTLFHAQNLARLLQKNNVPYADGENYILAASVTLKFELLQDAGNQGFVDVKKYAASGAEGILKNEIGTVAQFRVIVDNDALADGIGTGSAFGSGFVCGYEAIKELMVYPMHFRYNGNLGGDFANQKGIAWQSLEGWVVPWNFTTHGQGSICHITSA